ncbi:hypothetical protein ABH992_005080 [Bradyrhizobium yuanmingense]|uniref:Uncharacterized protein n=1 Tax=Bradyrhizobium yuanmingense TaxID=108015 RepID=A0ABV4GL51_9BRAD
MAFCVRKLLQLPPYRVAPSERRQLDDRIHGVEQCPVVADDNRAAAPGSQQIGDGLASVLVEIVGGLVQQQEVRRSEHQRGETNPRDLATGQARQRRIGRRIEPEARQRGLKPRLERPVDRSDLVGGGVAPLGTAHQLERRPHAEQIRHDRAGKNLHVLA